MRTGWKIFWIVAAASIVTFGVVWGITTAVRSARDRENLQTELARAKTEIEGLDLALTEERTARGQAVSELTELRANPTVVEVPVEVEKIVEVPAEVPIIVPDLTKESIQDIMDVLTGMNAVIYTDHLFQGTRENPTLSEPVIAYPPEGYNVTVLSTDPASLAIGNAEPFFTSVDKGVLAIVVGAGPIEIRDVGFSATHQWRNVSGYSIGVKKSGEDLLGFAGRIAAFEWTREYKPILVMYVVETDILYRLDASSWLTRPTEGEIGAALDELFVIPEAGN